MFMYVFTCSLKDAFSCGLIDVFACGIIDVFTYGLQIDLLVVFIAVFACGPKYMFALFFSILLNGLRLGL